VHLNAVATNWTISSQRSRSSLQEVTTCAFMVVVNDSVIVAACDALMSETAIV
jgi:hypothetical protein